MQILSLPWLEVRIHDSSCNYCAVLKLNLQATRPFVFLTFSDLKYIRNLRSLWLFDSLCTSGLNKVVYNVCGIKVMVNCDRHTR